MGAVMKITFTLNGDDTTLEIPGTKRLLDVLRDECGLTGTKEGCGKGECGACSILFDGRVANSCLILACQADGHEIVTVEGLEATGEGARLLDAFAAAGAVQCGFCIPGMLIAAKALLDRNPRPTRDDVARALSGNLCRCTGYTKIVDGVMRAADDGR